LISTQFDFERIGKEKVFEDLVKELKSQATHLHTSNPTMNHKVNALRRIQELAETAAEVGSSIDE
jgi:shikimate 5-dehydrogenase